MKYDDVLLIHMGGLGDMCLSESTFFSLSRYFHKNISALGYSRFFIFFQEYFKTINSIESAKWLCLFSDYPSKHTWKRIVFVGKDKKGDLRRRWQSISEEEMIFIEAFPDDAFGAVSSESEAHSSEISSKTEDYQLKTKNSRLKTVTHIEDYQLAQLIQYGIKPLKKKIEPRPQNRVILYPEASITKSKWPHENFIELYHALKQQAIEVYIFESLGLDLPISDKIVIEDLVDVKNFLDTGGTFVSNDSGMAHFAAMCGLLTVTIFSDFDPAIWHPRGKNISVRLGVDSMDLPDLKNMVFQLIIEGKDQADNV